MKPRRIVRISRGVAAGQAASVSRKRSIFSQAPRQSTSRHLIRMFRRGDRLKMLRFVVTGGER